jgi:hypothetical protein
MLRAVLTILLLSLYSNSFAIGRPSSGAGRDEGNVEVVIYDPFLVICNEAQQEAHVTLVLTGKRDPWTMVQATQFVKKFLLDSTPRQRVEGYAAVIQKAANETLKKAQVVYPTIESRNLDLMPIGFACARSFRDARDPRIK